MEEWSEREIERTLEQVRMRSLINPGFRRLALTDPAAAISEVNSKPLPQGYSVKFLDNSGSVKSFLLPDPAVGAEELSDAELEAVAGGTVSRVGQPGGCF